MLGGTVHTDLNDFVTSTDIEARENTLKMKVYHYANGYRSVPLHFDTIHGVKGETHTVTLFRETFNRLFDVGGKIIVFITSDDRTRDRHRRNSAFKKRLPLAYVALTRATHFIALAVDKERFTEEQERYLESKKDYLEVIYIISDHV